MKWLLFLIVIGLAAVSWVNRDKIAARFGHTAGEAEEAPLAPVTPHPAPASIAKARKVYPALALANSPFNKKFVELYNGLKETNPQFLAKPDWPMQLADQTANILNGPVPTYQKPTELSGSSLNTRPPGSAPGASATPALQLPGLKGSALDQRPAERGHH